MDRFLLIVGLSVAAQLFAAGLALRLLRLTGRTASWLLVAGGLLLMAFRRLSVLIDWYRGVPRHAFDETYEAVGLAISVTFAVGIGLIGPLFRSIRDSARAARGSELRYRGVFDSAREAVFLFEQETGAVVDANAAAASLFGYSREELLDLREADLAAPSEVRPATGRATSFVPRYFRKKDGTVFPAEASGGSFTVDGRRISVVSLRDVTLRLRFEEKVLRAERVMAVGRMAAGVAHRLNNMMVAVTGYSSLLLQRLSPGDPQAKELRQILEAGRRAAALTRQLLAIGRRQMLEPKEVELNAFLSSLAPRLREIAGERIAVEVEAASEPLRVFLDPEQLGGSIEALVANARDAITGEGKVTVRAARCLLSRGDVSREEFSIPPGPYALLSVRDTGCGMDAETRSRLFTPFFTTKPDGDGLDLASTYGFVKQSGGYILAESDIGKGTTFSLFFPLVPKPGAGELPEASEEPSIPSVAGLPEGENAGFAGALVLVMDDDPVVREVAGDILAHFGCRVLFAANGEEAIAAYEAAAAAGRPVDAAILDLTVPVGMNGREAARRLLEVDPGARLVVSSGYADDPVMADFPTYGFCAALPKPYRLRDFRAALAAALSGRGGEARPDPGESGPG